MRGVSKLREHTEGFVREWFEIENFVTGRKVKTRVEFVLFHRLQVRHKPRQHEYLSTIHIHYYGSQRGGVAGWGGGYHGGG